MADAKQRPGMNKNAQPLQTEDELNAALRVLGFLIPVTDAEVRQAEAEMVGSNIELPAALRDDAFLDRRDNCESADEVIHVDFDANDPAALNLARAAREGSTISDEVEVRMQQDRKRSEILSNGRT